MQRQADITIPKRDVKKQLETRFRIGNLLGQMAFNLTVKVDLNDCVCVGHVSDWMVEGRTLIMKGKSKATLVENYRPIACLNFSWKILTGIFAEKTYLYLLVSKLLLY